MNHPVWQVERVAVHPVHPKVADRKAVKVMLKKAESQPAHFLPILFLGHVVLVQQLVLVEQAVMDTILKTYILLKVPLKITIPSQTEVTHMGKDICRYLNR